MVRPAPPIGGVNMSRTSRIDSRMRCPRNHAVFILQRSIRWIWWVDIPFLLAHIRWMICSHRCSGRWDDSKMVPIPHREGLAPGVALVEAGAGRLALQAADALGFPAMVADGTVGPQPRLHIGESGGFVLEMRGRKNIRGHDTMPRHYIMWWVC